MQTTESLLLLINTSQAFFNFQLLICIFVLTSGGGGWVVAVEENSTYYYILVGLFYGFWLQWWLCSCALTLLNQGSLISGVHWHWLNFSTECGEGAVSQLKKNTPHYEIVLWLFAMWLCSSALTLFNQGSLFSLSDARLAHPHTQSL